MAPKNKPFSMTRKPTICVHGLLARDHREKSDQDDRQRDGQRIAGEQIAQRNDRLRDEEGDHHQRAADQQAGRHVDVHHQFTGDIEPLDDPPQNPRDHDHFDHAGQRRGDVNVLIPGQKGHEGRRQGEKDRLQRKQIDTGRQPALRHDGKAGSSSKAEPKSTSCDPM